MEGMKYTLRTAFVTLLLSFFLASCASDPRKVDVEIKEKPPEAKVTSYTQALNDLGLMTEIYATGPLKIQSNPIGDNTGTSAATGGEVPRDITEIMKSSLNSIGGSVVYIPYDPAFIQNQMATGYSAFGNKTIPDVILSGGITEFDRGLVTRSTNTDASADVEISGLPNSLPSKDVGARYGDSSKEGLSRITLDFNLLDFQTMAGIPKMNTVNSMEVQKALAGKELAVSLFGQTFGVKGNIKKVQGRHAAVRLLVELSMIQIIGKHLVVPYWRLLGDGANPDKVVVDAISKYYYNLNDAEAIAAAQGWLYLYGYDVRQTGVLDAATQNALQQADNSFKPGGRKIELDTFLNVYANIPIDQKTLKRREMLTAMAQQQQQGGEQAAAVNEAPQEPQGKVKAVSAQQEAQPQAKAAAQESAQPKKKTAGSKKIGRILSEDEW